MRTVTASFLALLALCMAGPAFAQQARVLPDDDWCHHDRSYDDDSERYCEVREITLPAGRSVIAVDAGQNGGIEVKGWDRSEILVRAKVEAHAETEAAARSLAGEVTIHTGTTISADVPQGKRRQWAYASFELFVPKKSNLALETRNGGISIREVEGDVAFEALNGGVSLVALAGNVSGKTTNGGLEIELTGPAWRGEGLDVKTTNGGVEIIVPESYSAQLETGTVNGKVRVDFPITVQGRLDRHFSTTLGRGGQPIRVVTTNGSIEIRKG